MQLVLNILLVFILINAVLKFSFWRLWQVVAAAVLSVLFLFWAYPYAMEQSQVTIQNALETPSILSNIAVLVTIEVALCLTFCFSELKGLFFAEKNRWNTFLKACPALLMFPVLFYLLTQSFFYFSGMDFFTITMLFSAGSALFIIGGAWCIQAFFPERDFRIEVHLLTSLFIGILGLIITSSGNLIYVPKSEPISFKFLGFSFILFIGIFILGMMINRWYWKLKR